jgi:hypothetical protein
MILEKAEGIPPYLEELTKLFLAADETGQSLGWISGGRLICVPTTCHQWQYYNVLE